MRRYVHRADLGPDVLVAHGFTKAAHVIVLNSRPALADRVIEEVARLIVAQQPRPAPARLN